jgi:hypothetical protein
MLRSMQMNRTALTRTNCPRIHLDDAGIQRSPHFVTVGCVFSLGKHSRDCGQVNPLKAALGLSCIQWCAAVAFPEATSPG